MDLSVLRVTTDHITIMADVCKKLRKLCINTCPTIDGNSLVKLASRVKTLGEIELANSTIENEDLLSMLISNTGVTRIQTQWSNVGDEFADFLRQSRPELYIDNYFDW